MWLGAVALVFFGLQSAAAQEGEAQPGEPREMLERFDPDPTPERPSDSKPVDGGVDEASSLFPDQVGEPGDAHARAVRALTEADRALNAAAAARDRESFGAWLADEAVFFAETAHRGRDAFLTGWGPLWEGKYDFRVDATSLEATVARSGDVGYTLGEVETRFRRPGLSSDQVTKSHYLNVWRRVEPTALGADDASGWRLVGSSTLVVHPTLGAGTDPRSGLMTAWPALVDQIDAAVTLEWTPETTVRAASDDLAWSLGTYRSTFVREGAREEGGGAFLAVWRRAESTGAAPGAWKLVAEGYTPPVDPSP